MLEQMCSGARSTCLPSWSASIKVNCHGRGWCVGLRAWRRVLLPSNSRHGKIVSITNPKRLTVPIGGLHIDRKNHLDQSWRRQQEEEARQAEAEVTCPVDCVREVYNCAEFERVLQEAESLNDLVVVDFYNSSCGACKYILPQFVKLCKRGCTDDECDLEAQRGVVFVKHNVRDVYDDLTVYLAPIPTLLALLGHSSCCSAVELFWSHGGTGSGSILFDQARSHVFVLHGWRKGGAIFY